MNLNEKSGIVRYFILISQYVVKRKNKDTQDAQKQPQCVRSLQLKSCPNLSKLKGSTLQEGHLFNFLSFKDKKKSFSILFWKSHLFGYFFPKLFTYNENKNAHMHSFRYQLPRSQQELKKRFIYHVISYILQGNKVPYFLFIMT